MVEVRFHGVRGSTPCACEQVRRYGGNTSCVSVESPGEPPILLDIGTGLRLYGLTQPQDGSFRGTALVSHLHWDHVQGLPFFTPVLRPGASLTLYAPPQDDGRSTHETFDAFMRPPYFPVRMDELPGDIRFEDCDDGWFAVGEAEVLGRAIPHVGRTFGYRVSWHGVSVAYLPDHQQPYDGGFEVAQSALELADGADVLIHDAQYTAAEFDVKRTWGHCTYEYALHVAREAGASTLVLFHHDPIRDDAALDAELRRVRDLAERSGVEVLAAAEGMVLPLGHGDRALVSAHDHT